MKKQKALEFLVKNLGRWPIKKKYAPFIDGYRWVKDTDGELFLFDNTGTEGDLKITRKEWLLAELNHCVDTLSPGATMQKGRTNIAPSRLASIQEIPKVMQKVYIAGGMTGYDNFNRKAFNDTALKLSMEYIVLNPAILPDGLSQKDYMSICLPMVACCDVIYMLGSYEDSSGALAELALAEKLGLRVILEVE